MSKAPIVGAVALMGLAVAGGIVASAEDSTYRYAVGDVQCLIDEGFTEDRMNQVCASWEIRGGYVGCVRPREAPVHKCEVPRAELPAAEFRKLMGCRCDFGEGTVDIVRLVEMSWVKPAECVACITICPSVINSKSRANVWSELEECLEAQCPGCDVTPTSWGPCPHCLAPGRDCATECAE